MEVRQILLDAVKDEPANERLDSCIAARFAKVGLREDLPELRGQPARRPALGG